MKHIILKISLSLTEISTNCVTGNAGFEKKFNTLRKISKREENGSLKAVSGKILSIWPNYILSTPLF